MTRANGGAIGVVLVAPTLEILGGQSVCARDLLRHLTADGVAASLLPVNPRFPRGLRWIRRIKYVRTVVNEVLYLASLVRLARADVVHAFSASYWSFLLAPVPAMVAGRLFGCQVLLHYHSGEAADHLGRWSWRVHPWLRLPHAIVVPSSYLAGVFAEHGYHAHVVENTVDLGAFGAAERRTTGHRLLSVRNLEAIYRVDVLVDAFALVRERFPDATLTISGVGRCEAALRAQVARLGLDGAVRFLGRVEPADMPRVYRQADLFVNASEVDNQPLSVLEAFAANLPVITTPAGDLRNMVVDGRTGVIVGRPDPQLFAEAIARLFHAPDESRGLAERARRSLVRHTWPAQRQRWAALYAGAMPPQPAGAISAEVR